MHVENIYMHDIVGGAISIIPIIRGQAIAANNTEIW
jgi:hypothetical protein